LLGDFAIDISTFCIVHDNTEVSAIRISFILTAELLSVHKGFAIGNNVRVSHRFKESDFVEGFFLLFAIHFGDINDLSILNLGGQGITFMI